MNSTKRNYRAAKQSTVTAQANRIAALSRELALEKRQCAFESEHRENYRRQANSLRTALRAFLEGYKTLYPMGGPLDALSAKASEVSGKRDDVESASNQKAQGAPRQLPKSLNQ